tara:strand:- start:187 stop:615 length:429 start_codon:yes stop_codon:yes gene_type:complete
MTSVNKAHCVTTVDEHEWSSGNDANAMWTAIDGDNLPQGIDMVVFDNAMVSGSEEALACLAALHSKPQATYFEKTPHDQVIVSYTMERLDRAEQGSGFSEDNSIARMNTMQDHALRNLGKVFEGDSHPTPPAPTHNNSENLA